ncbi:SGNH/GDSL hydrolase family protein, partial [Planctomycetota bacterium]
MRHLPVPIVVLLLACAAGFAGEAPVTAIVAFGDSTTAPLGKLVVYAQILQKELPGKGLPVKVVNAGVSGDTTAMARARFDRDVLARDPRLVIIQLGICDSAVDVSKGAAEPRLPRPDYEKNLRHFIRTLRGRGARMILMTPNPRRWTPSTKKSYGKPPYRVDDPKGFNAVLTDYVASMRTVANAEGAPLIDVFEAFESYGKVKGRAVDELLSDGIHPNDKGHRLVANLLVPQILTLLKPAAGKQRAVFIGTGEPVQLARGLESWKRGKGYLEAGGTDKELWAGKAIGKGDFHVTARLAILKLARSAAAFRIGDSYFGFEGGHGKVFLTGPLFQAHGKPIGEPTDFMT